MLSDYVPASARNFMPAMFFRAASAIVFSPAQFKERLTEKGQLVRLTHSRLNELGETFVHDFIVARENVAKYPVDKAEQAQALKTRFGDTGRHRSVSAILDDAGLPLSITYMAFGNKYIGSLNEATSGAHDCADGENPTTVTFYSASNLAHKCGDPAREVLAKGIGTIQVDETVASLMASYPSLGNFVTLSPLTEYEKWIQKAPDAELQPLLDEAGISVADFKNMRKPLFELEKNPLDDSARAQLSETLRQPDYDLATRLTIAHFMFLTETKTSKDGKITVAKSDQALNLHIGKGDRAAIADILLDDPLDPRVRYVYIINGKKVVPDMGANDEFINLVPATPAFAKYVRGENLEKIRAVSMPVKDAPVAGWRNLLRRATPSRALNANPPPHNLT